MDPRPLVSVACVLCAAAMGASTDARACSPPSGPEPVVVTQAPVGGVWWVREDGPVDGTVALVDEDGQSVAAAVVSRGAASSLALRVPQAPIGAVFHLPQTFSRPDLSLEVIAGDAPAVVPRPSPPEVGVELEEVTVGYAGVLLLPLGPPCGRAAGIWSIEVDERPVLRVDSPGEELALDINLQHPDEEPFAEVESGNEVLFDGTWSEDVERVLTPPPEAPDLFVMNARVRRIADGVASEVVSIEVEVPPPSSERRLEWVGCSCQSGDARDAAVWFAVPLVALRLSARRAPRQ